MSLPSGDGVLDLELFDARARRSVAQRALEPLDRLGLAFGRRLDASVGQVAHPPVQAFARRRRLCEIAEADALDAAADEYRQATRTDRDDSRS